MKQNITESCKKKPTKDNKFAGITNSKETKTNSTFKPKTNDCISKNDKTANAKESVYTRVSMVRKVNGILLIRKFNHKYLGKVRLFSSAKGSCMNDHVKPTLWDFKPEHIILPVSTDDLNTERAASQIAKSIIDVCHSLKTDANTITVSLIIRRYDNLNIKANEVNNRLMNIFKERNIPYIDHADTVLPESQKDI